MPKYLFLKKQTLDSVSLQIVQKHWKEPESISPIDSIKSAN